IDSGRGDTERLRTILTGLQNGQPLETSDQQYVESLTLKTAELETNEDSMTFDNTSIEQNNDANLNSASKTDDTVHKTPKVNTKKIAIASIVIAAIFFSFVGVDAYAVSTIQIRPHQGTQYALSETVLHVQADVCNPSYFPASFHNYEINAVYKSQVLETVSISGNMISPKSSLLLDGTFTINKESLSEFSKLGSGFDPNEALVKTKLDAPIFGFIPFTINKDYHGNEFANIVKNGPPGGYQC
ncbi:MAG TPA: hypothetical protein VK431_04965, partial [Nitrosopumilaceae archaeon]|nr:hypothetical protein [Nitrosopumilaceae archaeon]